MPSRPRRAKSRASDPLTKLRKLCLSLPEAHEVIAWGEPTFRVKNKMFATFADANNHHGAGRPSAWCKATLDNQALMVRHAPERFFVPPYVGVSGWVGIYLDQRPNWSQVMEILTDSYRAVAPKKLAALLGDR